MTEKVWFLTGASRGFGREWATAALERGDKVAATVRDTATLAEMGRRFGAALLPIELDVTDRVQAFDAVDRAHEHFGRLDVVVNNAGYGHMGFVEELTEQEARQQLETNLFGTLWITQAALPLLRAQRSGHILQVSSLAGLASLPGIGIYCASKFAVEGMSEALAHEVKPFGIHVTLVEPGVYATDWAGSSAVVSKALDAYEGAHQYAAELSEQILGAPGDPKATAEAILAIVDSEEPPLRVLLGARPFGIVSQIYADRTSLWEKWQPVSTAAHG